MFLTRHNCALPAEHRSQDAKQPSHFSPSLIRFTSKPVLSSSRLSISDNIPLLTLEWHCKQRKIQTIPASEQQEATQIDDYFKRHLSHAEPHTVSAYVFWLVCSPTLFPERWPQYIFISTSTSKIGQAKPKRQLLSQSVTTAKFRPHPCIQQLKMGPRQQFRAEAQNRLCIFTSCIFTHYVMIFLHNLLSHSPSSNPVGPFFFFFCSCSLKYQCTGSLLILFFFSFLQLNVFLYLWCCVSSRWCCLSLSVLCDSSYLWPEAVVECRFIISSHPCLSLSLSLTFGLPSFHGSKNRHTIHFLNPGTVVGCLSWWSEKNRGSGKEKGRI